MRPKADSRSGTIGPRHQAGGLRPWVLIGISALALVIAAWWWTRPAQHQSVGIQERAAEMAKRQTRRLSDEVIPATDLPPEGTRSLFDHLLAENGGLPYPFESLVALIQSYDPQAGEPRLIQIPDGRSLLKAQADFEHPRILYAADFLLPNSSAMVGVAPRGQLFLGFVENAAEIEVISYNEFAGRFEFQLVKDYRADGVPKIVYSQRGICLTCHQGAAPIFPERPWNETNGQPEIAQRIIAARGSEAPYQGAPLRNPLAAPERFDELTDIANFIPVTQAVWIDGCGEDGLACRRQMLKTALKFFWQPGDFDPQGPGAQRLRTLQAPNWPKDGIGAPNSDISNRDPLETRRGFGGWLRGLLHRGPQLPGARSNDELDAFDALPKLPPALNPQEPRGHRRLLTADDLDGAYGIAQLFTPADLRTLEAASGHQWAAVAEAVDALPQALFEAAPFSRVRTLNALLQLLGEPALDYCCDTTEHLSAPVVGGLPPLELAADSPLQPFVEYCFACHRGNPSARLNFMGGKDAETVLAQIQDTPSIRDVLDWDRYLGTAKAGTLMPPADSPQRAALESAVAAGEPSLEEMRKVVPSMFDF